MSSRKSGGGAASNHRGSGGGDDVYRQLIDSNDLVRELDDIEAISQQISQHAEVLYQSWKNNAAPTAPSPAAASPSRQQQHQLQQLQHQPRHIPIQRQNSAPPSPSSPPASAASFSSPFSSPANGGVRPRENGVGGGGHVQAATLHRIPMSSSSSSTNHRSPPMMIDDRDHRMMNVARNGPTTTTAAASTALTSPPPPTRLHEQIARAQSAYEPVRSATLPSSARVRSASNGSPAPLTLTAPAASSSSSSSSPAEGGGGGFDRLLSSPEMNGNLKDLVNSFVSTDRAKQAARNTISTTINNMKSRNGGGVRSPSPSTTSSSRAVSPLKTPLLLGPLSPGASSTTSSSSSATTPSTTFERSTPTVSPFDNVHQKMQPIFISSGNDVGGGRWTPNKNETRRPQEPISIPVRHVGRQLSTDSTDGPAASSSSSAAVTLRGEGLQSPSVLMQSIKPARRQSNRNSLEFDAMPLPALHAANVDRMRQRFEEAKQRMNLMHQRALDSGLIARGEGGGAGGSNPGFTNLRSSFEDSRDQDDDFMIEQLRRRTARRSTPVAPHPELTPQQRQHIIERSNSTGSMAATTANAAASPVLNYSSQGFPMRRFLSGGSVAERVLAFEKSPTVFGLGSPAPVAVVASGDGRERRIPIMVQPPPPPTPLLFPSAPEVAATKLETSSWMQPSRDIQSQPSSLQPSNAASNHISTTSLLHTSSKAIPIAGSAGTIAPSIPLTTQATAPSSPPLKTSSSSSPSSSFREPQSVYRSTSSRSSAPATIPSSSAAASAAVVLLPTASPSLLSSPAAATVTPSPSSSRGPSRPLSSVSLASSSRPGSLYAGKSIPKFHFPLGNPALSSISLTAPGAVGFKQVTDEFRSFKSKSLSKAPGVTLEEFGQILKNCGFRIHWKSIIYMASNDGKTASSSTSLTLEALTAFWRRMESQNFHDEASQFVYIVTRSSGRRCHLLPEDFVPLVQDVVDSHPGLGFLKEATEFHSRYVHTVIARIFYCVNRSWSGRITIPEMRKSNFLAVLSTLDEEEDINQVTDFFSYEHFYVIYCKFWELDKDHDLFIDREDLSRHNDHAISTRMIDRIFSGAVTRGATQREGKMSYTEFVWFLIAEEDKRHPTAIEYWFRCMDLDGDGYLSMYELEYFYEEQLQRMEQLGIETLPFEDCLCQMLDMIIPEDSNRISMRDLKGCRMTPIFFDTFFNLEKYLDHEQRDPFASQRDLDEDGNEMSDWDRFASEEYELLVAEEGNTEGMDELCYDDDENMPEMHLDETLDNAGGAAGIGAVVSVAKSGNTDLGVGPHESPMMAN